MLGWQRLFRVATMAVVLAFAGQGHAHNTDQGPHGGLVVESNGHHIELTTKGTDLTLYLIDEAHAATPSAGASGRAVVLEGAKQSTVPLTAAEPNRLSGKLAAPLSPGARIVVSVKLVDGHDLLARFVLK